MQFNQASKLAKPAPAHYSSISCNSCPLGWVQRFNLIISSAWKHFLLLIFHSFTYRSLRQKCRFCTVCFTGLIIFCQQIFARQHTNKLGIKKKYICCQSSSHFLEVSALVISCMFCKEASQGAVRSVPGIQWTWGQAVRALQHLKHLSRIQSGN